MANQISNGVKIAVIKTGGKQYKVAEGQSLKIEKIEEQNGHASMIMLGNAVMSDIPFEGATKYIISGFLKF